MEPIHTQRLRLIPADVSLLRAAVAGEAALAEALQATVRVSWTEFGHPAFRYARRKVEADPAAAGWWAWFPILKEENALIGSGGYKGPPDEAGMVEIGYEIAPAWRGRGLATEMAAALIDRAFRDPRVRYVQAHTMAERNASARVLEKCGLERTEEIEVAGEGRIWRWRVHRNA